jgi:hypothetical protein
MDEFSFAFSLFGFLMGLAIAEALGGFGKALELRHKIRVGWLSPLLAVAICFDIVSFWLIAWQTRHDIPISFISLAAGLIIFGLYYLIAQLVFPEDIEQWPDLDDYYFKHRRWLIGGMYACNLLSMSCLQLLGIAQATTLRWWIIYLAFTLGVAAVAFAPGKRWSLAALIYYLLLYPTFDLLGMFGPNWY